MPELRTRVSLYGKALYGLSSSTARAWGISGGAVKFAKLENVTQRLSRLCMNFNSWIGGAFLPVIFSFTQTPSAFCAIDASIPSLRPKGVQAHRISLENYRISRDSVNHYEPN